MVENYTVEGYPNNSTPVNAVGIKLVLLAMQ
jgi:hypothetical protein